MPEKYEKPKPARAPKFKPPLSVDELRQLDAEITDPTARRLLWEIYRLRAQVGELEKLVKADAEILAKMQDVLAKGPDGHQR